jgi:hypothetical protein
MFAIPIGVWAVWECSQGPPPPKAGPSLLVAFYLGQFIIELSDFAVESVSQLTMHLAPADFPSRQTGRCPRIDGLITVHLQGHFRFCVAGNAVCVLAADAALQVLPAAPAALVCRGRAHGEVQRRGRLRVLLQRQARLSIPPNVFWQCWDRACVQMEIMWWEDGVCFFRVVR